MEVTSSMTEEPTECCYYDWIATHMCLMLRGVTRGHHQLVLK
jgi:hypothetical protein